jgi:hypothetical protein
MANAKTYKSKIGLELAIPIVVVFAGVFVINIFEDPNWFGIASLLVVFAFVIHLFLTTNYKIDGDQLTVKSGFIVNKQIEITAITKIVETNNPISSPATSIDRLEIMFNKYDTIVISPKLKSEFLAHILLINPHIEVVYK